MIDLDALDGRIELEAEVCVIGAGAAGISLARRLLDTGRRCCCWRAAASIMRRRSAALNAGANVGEDYYDLEDSRLRFFGGTTAIWGGRCAELDPIDLKARDYVPYSGWPIGWEELRRWCDEARPLFGLPPRRPGPADLRRAGVPLPDFDPAELETPLWTFDRRFSRFAFASCRDLEADPRCRIAIHATATGIVPAESGRAIEEVEARSLGSGRLTVRAKTFVLAAGGIENPRLLLGFGARQWPRPGRPLFHGASPRPRRTDRRRRRLEAAQGLRPAAPGRRARKWRP